MENFALLGSLAARLHAEFRGMFYILLPIFFGVALVLTWFRSAAQGPPDFVDVLKRAIVATLLLVGFQEITDTILTISNGISSKISDMSGIDTIIQMAGDKAKSYTVSVMTPVLAFNDLMVSVLSYCSFLILYVVRYVMVALYHFSWVFLVILSPFMLLFHLFSSKMTLTLFKSLMEIASWQIVWSVLAAILKALPFGNAYATDGNYLTVILINFLVGLCMFGTPFVVHALVGNGFSAVATSLSPAVIAAMAVSPRKSGTLLRGGREMISDTARYTAYQSQRLTGQTNRNSISKQKLEPNRMKENS
jgi:hypothetical protein